MSQNSASTRTLLLMGIQEGGIVNAVVEELAQHAGYGAGWIYWIFLF